MTKIQNILFPVDFSPACAAMAGFVRRAVEIFSAHVTLVHVWEVNVSAFELVVRPLPDAEADLQLQVRAKLDAFLDAEFPPRDFPRLLLKGDPATHLAQVARERRFDLIIMPTHSGVFRRMLLGSTTAKVLNDSDCPVLTTQHAETLSPRPWEHREYVCAIGFSPDSARVLSYASQTAASVHANLALLHAIPRTEPGGARQLDLEELVQTEERQAARRRMEELQNRVGSRAPVTIVTGPVKDALIAAASHLRADALIIGRSPQAGSVGRLRDLTYAMVRDAPCPVLSV